MSAIVASGEPSVWIESYTFEIGKAIEMAKNMGTSWNKVQIRNKREKISVMAIKKQELNFLRDSNVKMWENSWNRMYKNEKQQW